MDIKQARELAGLSKSDLTRILGIPSTTIDGWDYYHRLPPVWCERLLIKEFLEIAKEKEKGTFNPVARYIDIKKAQIERDLLKLKQASEKKDE